MDELPSDELWGSLIAASITGGEVEAQPAIEMIIDPGNAPAKAIQEVLEALSDLHIAAGGLGMVFEFRNGQWVGVLSEGPQTSPHAPTYVIQA